jgi:threonine/homoserine/homoserine lactone efflux protein
MSYSENLWLFLILLIGIIAVPGMDMFFVLTNALTGGRRAGLAATGGIMAGGAVHTLFGALGVGLIAATLPGFFTVLLFAGAAYMAWIGLTLLRSSITVDSIKGAASRSRLVAFRQGAITCLLNPKAYLFVMAVYPQFLKPAYGSLWPQALAMGAMTLLIQFAIYGGLALAAGRSRSFLTSSPRSTMLIGRGAGAIFIAVAALTAWHGWQGA